MDTASESFVYQAIGTGVLGIASIGCLVSGFTSLRRKRLIENVPTSKVAGVFLGLTEVKGEAEDEPYLRSYLAGRECVWFSYSIEEEWRKTEHYTDSKGNRQTRTSSGWTTVKSADVRDPFFVRDDTGRIRVEPEGADIEGEQSLSRVCGVGDPLYYGKGPAGAISHSTFRRRFTENVIGARASVYAIGSARLREDVVEPEIAANEDEELFLISVKSEDAIVRSLGIWAVVKLVLGALALNIAPNVLLYDARLDPDPLATVARLGWMFMAGGSALYLFAIFVHYLVLLYNGLVSVRNRVAMAWSQIDIQLKRRHDLIPNLVSCVKGYVKHEKDTLEQLARIRVEGLTTSGERRVEAGIGLGRGVPVGGAALAVASLADEQTRALSSLYGIVERYPEIKADKSFWKMQDELSKTETRIALARAFYNESVTALNNRIETIPDALIAKPGGFKTVDYFKIEDFEKAPVQAKVEADAGS